MNKCYLTDLNANITHRAYFDFVVLNIDGREVEYSIDDSLVKPRHDHYQYFDEHKHIIAGMLVNDRIDRKTVITYWDDVSKTKPGYLNIKEVIELWDYPKSPKEKKDNLLNCISNKLPFEGAEINWNPYSIDDDSDPAPWFKFFFKERGEASFYMETLKEENLIKANGLLSITYKGLNYIIENKRNRTIDSKTCFIAMSFQ